ncbi:chemotaxis protein CheA [Cesiribacter sp. SM1]|uniref:chemotaxis protein CheA n=1 Tax=Cesiribacter sp. SM1 TaxID=2861196 RepID=UPI001CD685F8|nr:chemotaxis protein CheA [Cesiribacter sp. SM1]
MIEHLKQKYLEEAHDLLLELEKTLLLLEENPADSEGVEVAFRVMHTLKGSSGMFGYQQVSELVHLLENGYDTIRTNKQAVPLSLLELSLESVDHIRLLLTEDTTNTPATEGAHRLLLKRAAELLYEMPAPEDERAMPAAPAGKSLRTWAIFFAPQQDMLKNGSNPLYLLEELAGFGGFRSFSCTGQLPPLTELDVQQCYLSWMLLLATEAPEGDIRDVFMFVEELCQLQLEPLGEGDLLADLKEEQLTALADKIALALDKESFAAYVRELKTTTAQVKPVVSPETAQETTAQLASGVKEKSVTSIRVASDKLDDLMNLVSELVANQERLSLLAELSMMPELAGVAEEIEKITRQLRDKTFDICLVPIGSLLTRFKRLVRDLSQELGKNIAFEAEGMDTELDKNVIDSLSDCLVHILRNCIDHGLEAEAERIAKGKNPQGTILLKAFNSGTNVVIEIKDDGRGISSEKVRNKAVEKGLIRPDQVLTEKESLELILMPGFSTAQSITSVSGRGVGLDVVKKKIKELRGEVSIASKVGQGATITIALPLTISIIDGLLVRVADTDYVLPLSFVEKSYSVTPADLLNTKNNQLILDGEPVIYFNLAEAFSAGSLSNNAFGVVIHTGTMRMALLVDEIIGEYQAVLKPLGKFYQEQDFLSGGSLMGDGTVALVLDPQKLIQEITKNRTIDI